MFNNPQKRPADTAFKQQKLKAWQPILTPIPVIVSFILIGVIFIPVGYVLLDASNSVVQYQSEAYEDCQKLNELNECNITFSNINMKAPIYLYYKLENYYQNHRRYVKSRSDAQLRGQQVTSLTDLSDCAPYISASSNSSSPDYFYNPCGLIARSLFNDTFILQNATYIVPLSKDGVAWKSDLDSKFNNPPGNTGVRVIPDFKDVDFIVWMRTAALPTFRKLYRVINTDLQGDYTVTIRNNYNVTSFGGHKYVVLSTTSWLGGKNPFLGYAYMVVGAICIILGIIFALKHQINGRQQGDTSYLEWAKN